MEAVRRLPMISFELKNSPEATSFHNLKQCIAEYYGEDPESYTKEFRELEDLRGIACRPRTDMDCCASIKRYYSQLHSLQNRFPLSSDTDLLNFSWKDIYSGSSWHTSNIKYEMASILYNIAALHSKLGVEEERTDPESMKLACTHFQCAAWAFGEMKNQYGMLLRNDLSAELMIFKQQICFAQAQECILEKSLADNRKAAIIAKVTAQVISFYNAAMSALFSQNEDGSIQDSIGSKTYKDWLKYIKFKTSYLSSVLFLYQGQHSEEQRKMGERVALFNAACDKLEEAKKEAKGMNKVDIINDALVLATDIIEGKRKNAKQENEFIYHESIPELSTISAVQGANLVQGIGFDVTDSQVIGEDIFKRLVPMKTHENLSLYSEEKANILRQLGAKIDDRDAELASFMGSLNIDILNSMKQPQEKLPQNLVDRCAELSAKPNAISDLVESMSSLANICSEVEISLNEIKLILDEENKQEQNFQKQIGKRPSGHMAELIREFTKYFDAHSKAGESNDTLRKAMELHVSNLKILAQPLAALKAQVPQSEPIDEEVRRDLENLLNKVEEMKTQRDGVYNELRDQILNKDDITSQLIAHGDKDVDELFKKELKKYSQSVNIIEQNLVAQGNILKALTDTYARHAMTLKAFNDMKSKREQFYSGLINSFDVYEDLMSKSAKGVDFYKKLHANIQKLMSRVKAARDVQDEERQQLLKNSMQKVPPTDSIKHDMHKSISSISTNNSSYATPTTGMKLKDYIKSGLVPNIGGLRDESSKLPSVRPSPLGQENISSANPGACSTINYPSNSYNQAYYQQQQQPHSVNPYMNQQQYFQQLTNSERSSPLNSSNASSTASLNNDYYASNMYGNQAINQGYINPMFQTGNQVYNKNMDGYSNYGQMTSVHQVQNQPTASTTTAPTTQLPPSYNQAYYNQQQQVDHNSQKNTAVSSASGYAISAATSHSGSNSNNYSANSHYYPQQTQINQNPNMHMSGLLTNSSFNQNTSMTQQYSMQDQTNQKVQPITSSINNTQQTTNFQQQNNSSVYASPNTNTTLNQQKAGEFNPNVYKNHFQYPNVQSPNQQQYPTVSTPASNQYASTLQNSYADTSQIQQQTQSTNQQSYPSNSFPQQQINQQYPSNSLQQQPIAQQSPANSLQQPIAQQSPANSLQQPMTQQPPSTNTQSANNNTSQQAISANQQKLTPQIDYSNYQQDFYQYIQNQPLQSFQTDSYNQYSSKEQGNQQNYSCYTPTLNSINAYMSSGNQQPQVTQSSIYAQDQATSNQNNTPQQQQQKVNTNENGVSMTNQTASTYTTPINSTVNNTTMQSTNSQEQKSSTEIAKPSVKNANIDLLSGIDFSVSTPTINDVPTLTPISLIKKNVVNDTQESKESPKKPIVAPVIQSSIKMNEDLADLDFSSLKISAIPPQNTQVQEIEKVKKFEDPFDDVNTLKQFHKEVEGLEKYMETLMVKTLSGATPLASKWNELQNLLVKDESSRSISIAKLFPEKNRFMDCLPYDHGRVLLPTATDNYINAVTIKDCGSIAFIMAQMPIENTVNDWWEMVWSQKSNILVCLHSSSELLDPFWPQNINEEKVYGDVTVTLLKQFELSHCIEKQLKVSRTGSDLSTNISLLQVKTWKKKSADHVLDISNNIITSFKQLNSTEKQYAPIILNCISGGTERSGLITLGISAIFATQMKKPTLLNVVDHWFRVCSQRKGVLEEESYLQLSLQIVLNHAHRILNKRGIMTTYQVKNAEKNSPIETEKAFKDSLGELDPFWKFK